jgi:5'-methylthioadenosine phosphorylase
MGQKLKLGLIGGTGLAELLGDSGSGKRHDPQTPFGSPSDSILETEWDGLPILVLGRHGPGHVIPPGNVPYRANIFALKQLGCTHILASGAVGSLRQEMKPTDLVIPDQLIDRTSRRASTFFENSAAHVEFAEPFCPVLRRILIEEGAAASASAGADSKWTAHDRGCYVCMEGPAFSTRAESLMHRLLGGDLIGMTALPEAKLAREAEIPYALIALVTDYDCWKTHDAAKDKESLLQEIMGNLQRAASRGMEVIRRTLLRLATDPTILEKCPAQSALQWAIWSDKSRLDHREIQRLAPIWEKYFETK